MKKYLIYTAVNAVTSVEMLKLVPHRMICDGLAIVYRYVEDGVKFSSVITNKAALELGFSEGQLYEMAKANLKHFLPVLHEEQEGVYTVTSLTGNVIGSSLALMPGVMERLLNKTNSEHLFVAVEPEKTTITTKASMIFKKMQEGNLVGRVMRYTRNGFSNIGFVEALAV